MAVIFHHQGLIPLSCCRLCAGGGKTLFNKDKESSTTTELVELRVFVRKGGKLKYELDGLRWKSSYVDDGSGEGPPSGIFTL
jgi:hypothetical protein